MRGEELTPWLIHYAYTQGAFPMTMEEDEVEWFQPVTRALFPIEGVHLSASMRRVVGKTRIGSAPPKEDDGHFVVTFDKDFEGVMRGCLRPDGNWISEHFIRVFTEIHFEGWGHSCEVWRGRELAGGIYGIALGSCFCAESMFHRRTNASKVALWAMVERCRELGFRMFDAEVMNPHLASMGAFPMPHAQYIERLGRALRETTPWSGGAPGSGRTRR